MIKNKFVGVLIFLLLVNTCLQIEEGKPVEIEAKGGAKKLPKAKQGKKRKSLKKEKEPLGNSNVQKSDIETRYGEKGLPQSGNEKTDNQIQPMGVGEQTNMQINQPYIISQYELIYTHDISKGVKGLKLEISGTGQIGIYHYKGGNVPNKTAELEMECVEYICFFFIDQSQYLSQGGDSLKIVLIKNSLNQTSGPIVTLSTNEKHVLKFNDRQKFYTIFSQEAIMVVQYDEREFSQVENKRIQFMLLTEMDERQVHSGSRIEMLINKGPERPREGKYDMRASGTLGNGLIKTIQGGSELYCLARGCEYSVMVTEEKIESFVFMPLTFTNGQILKVDYYMQLLEEAEIGEVVQYQLKMPENDDTWLFEAKPLMGSLTFCLSPDKQPTSDDCPFISHSGRSQYIIITKEQSQKKGWTHQSFWVSFKTNRKAESSVFKFVARSVDRQRGVQLKQGHAYLGRGVETQIITYDLQYDFSFQRPSEEISNTLVLQAQQEYMMVVKECQIYSEDCKVGLEDMSKEVVQNETELIFETTKGKSLQASEDEKYKYVYKIDLQFVCVNGFYYNNDKEEEGEGSYKRKSRSCHFAVGLVPLSPSSIDSSLYRLSLNGQSVHKGLSQNSLQIIKMYEKEMQLYEVDVRGEELLDNEFLEIKTYAIQGTCQLMVSFDNQHPSQTDNDYKIDINAENRQWMETQSKIVMVDLKRMSEKELLNINYQKAQKGMKEQLKSHKYKMTQNGTFEAIEGHKEDQQKQPQPDQQNCKADEQMRRWLSSEEGRFKKYPLYISIEALSHCVFDMRLRAIPFKEQIQEQEKPESINLNRHYHRSLDAYTFYQDVNTNNYYPYKSFLLNRQLLLRKQSQLAEGARLQIQIDTTDPSLIVCIQINSEVYDNKKACDFKTEIQHIELKKDDINFFKRQKIVIGVYKKMEINPMSREQLIKEIPNEEFSLLVTLQGVASEYIDMAVPGKTISALLHKGQSLYFKMSLERIKEKMLILFNGESPSITAVVSVISKGEIGNSEHLGNHKLGIRIGSVQQYRKRYCGGDVGCYMQVYVYAGNEQGGRFWAAYTEDNLPIELKDGDRLSIPNEEEQYFIYKAKIKRPVILTVSADSPCVFYAKVLTRGSAYREELSERDFHFKTGVETMSQLVIPSDMLEQPIRKTVAYLYEPKFIINGVHNPQNENGYFILLKSESATIVVSQTSRRLTAFEDSVFFCQKGDSRLFHFQTSNSSFSVILTVMAGSANMILGKGAESVPTVNDNLRTTAEGQLDQIQTIQYEVQEWEEGVRGSYSVVVHCNESSHLSIFWSHSFTGVERVSFQKIQPFRLKGGEFKYFDYFNRREEYNTIMFSEGGDVEVAALHFKASDKKDLVKELSNPGNFVQKFTIRANQAPHRHHSNILTLVDEHIIMKLNATKEDAMVVFCFYDEKRPIIAPLGQRFRFVLQEGEEVQFQVNLNTEHQRANVDIMQDFGQIEGIVSDKEGGGTQNDTGSQYVRDMQFKLGQQDHQLVKYIVTNSKENYTGQDIVLFNKVYIRVKASEQSHFSIMVNPQNRFIKLRRGQPELLFSDSQSVQYAYFYVTQEMVENGDLLQIQVQTIKAFNQFFNFMWMPEINNQIEGQSVFKPLRLKDIKIQEAGNTVIQTVQPEMQVGYVIVAMGVQIPEKPFKITIIINGQSNIQPNGIYSNYLKQGANGHSFNISIPSQGEARIVLESCANVKLQKSIFTPQENNKQIKTFEYDQTYYQAYPFMLVDRQNIFNKENQISLQQFEYPIRRVEVEGAGTLSFEIKSGTGPRATVGLTDYSFITEFRAKNKPLILKDYVSVFDADNLEERFFYGHNYREEGNILRISSRVPTLKPQIIQDYPDVLKAKMTLVFYLISDIDALVKMQKCGISFLKQIRKAEKSVTLTVVVGKQEVETESEIVEIDFDKNDFKLLKNITSLQVIAYADIWFIESSNDELHLSLNPKFTQVPLFLMSVPLFVPQKPVSLFFILIAFCAIFLAIIVLLIIRRQFLKQKQQFQNGYQKPSQQNYQRPDDTEMSSVVTSRHD